MKNKKSQNFISKAFDKQLRTKLFNFAFKVVRWLVITTCDTSLPLHHFDSLCHKLQKFFDQNGPLQTIKYVKAIRGNFYNYLSGNLLRNPMARTTRDGIPVILGNLIPLVRGGHMRAIALILTILTATRSLKIITEPDLSSITQPVKGDVPDLTKYMAQF